MPARRGTGNPASSMTSFVAIAVQVARQFVQASAHFLQHGMSPHFMHSAAHAAHALAHRPHISPHDGTSHEEHSSRREGNQAKAITRCDSPTKPLVSDSSGQCPQPGNFGRRAVDQVIITDFLPRWRFFWLEPTPAAIAGRVASASRTIVMWCVDWLGTAGRNATFSWNS